MNIVVDADIKEINLRDFGGIYSKDLFMYTIKLSTISGYVVFNNMRMIYLYAKSNIHIIFRFMNTNTYVGKDYRKYSSVYTQFDLFSDINLIRISLYTYSIFGDESSKEILEVNNFDINNCHLMQHFLHFLYTKYKVIFKEQ